MLRSVITTLLLCLLMAILWTRWIQPMLFPTVPPGLLMNQDGGYMVDSAGQPIIVPLSHGVHNPTFLEVYTFAKTNTLSDLSYEPGKYMCTEYALETRKEALAIGLKCAIVNIQFSQGIGHAMTAFQTTDKGLVFLDLTGGTGEHQPGNYNTIGYVQVGKPYGRLPLDIGAIDPSHYARYEETTSVWDKLQAKNDAIKQAHIQMDRRNAELKAELQKINTLKDQSQSNDDSAQVNEDVAKYNSQLAEFRKTCDALNHEVEAVNTANQMLERHYVENPYNVTNITFWWW